MNTTEPKISVLMPAYNVEKYVEESVDSIIQQSFQDFELIIVDDCSTDNTWTILQKYNDHPKIKLFRNDINMGISRTRNKLISLCDERSTYVVWQDSDDISFSSRIEHQYKYMEDHLDVGISAGYLEFFDENGTLSVREYPINDIDLRNMIFKASPVPQPAAIIRKVCFSVTGKFPEASPVAEDLAMSFQIGTKYKFGNLPELLIRYRQTPTNVTHTKLRIMEMYSVFLRYVYSKHPAYTMTISDKIFNVASYLSIFLVPTSVKIQLFNFFRNTRQK